MKWGFLRLVNGFLLGWFGGGALIRENYQLAVVHLAIFVVVLLALYKLEAISNKPPAP